MKWKIVHGKACFFFLYTFPTNLFIFCLKSFIFPNSAKTWRKKFGAGAGKIISKMGGWFFNKIYIPDPWLFTLMIAAGETQGTQGTSEGFDRRRGNT